MYLWAGFYKTGSSNLNEALSRMGWGNFRSTSEKFGFGGTFKKLKKNEDLFATMTPNNYLMIVDYAYSLIANNSRGNSPLEREKKLAENFQVEEFIKIYYENNSNIHAFAKGGNGLLEHFVYEDCDSRIYYELANRNAAEDESPFKIHNPFDDVSGSIEDITLKVFGIKIYAEFGDLDKLELEHFIRI